MITGSYGNCMFSFFFFLRSCRTVLWHNCPILHYSQQHMTDLVSLNPSQHLVLLLFFILAILIGEWFYLMWIYICVSLRASIFSCVYLPYVQFSLVNASLCLLFICSCSFWIKIEGTHTHRGRGREVTTAQKLPLMQRGARLKSGW